MNAKVTRIYHSPASHSKHCVCPSNRPTEAVCDTAREKAHTNIYISISIYGSVCTHAKKCGRPEKGSLCFWEALNTLKLYSFGPPALTAAAASLHKLCLLNGSCMLRFGMANLVLWFLVEKREREKKRHKHWCCHRRECEFVQVLMLKSLLGTLMKCLLPARGEVLVLHLMPLPLSVTKDVLRTETIFTPASFGDRSSSSSSSSSSPPPPH